MCDGLECMLQATNELAAVLDDQENQDFVAYAADGEHPEATLHRLLADRTTVSATPLSALLQLFPGTTGFRKIGFGQCGLVFERPGQGFVVKVARPHFHDALWSDFVAHFHVCKAFEQQRSLECRVPAVYTYINKDNTRWWHSHRPLFPEIHESFPLPSMALLTERILPLPRIVRDALISQYCPPRLQSSASVDPSNRDCLARVYLGRRRPKKAPLAPNFTLRNFNLCLDQMVDLDLPVNDYASAIGEALAVIHWQANVDGYDIEFVLASERRLSYTQDRATLLGLTPQALAALPPHTDMDSLMSANFCKRTIRIWVLDFNLCSRWENQIGWEHPDALIEQLVTAFFENDPYYPLPMADGDIEQKLWAEFRESYLRKSQEVLEGAGKDERLHRLPGMFINACIARERVNIEAGSGHGRRHHKD